MTAGSIRHMSFGWGAPPIREQAPMLSPDDATAFQADADTIIRLHIRGVLTDAERSRAITRLHKAIATRVLRSPHDRPRHRHSHRPRQRGTDRRGAGGFRCQYGQGRRGGYRKRPEQRSKWPPSMGGIGLL